VDAAASGAWSWSQGGLWSVSEQTARQTNGADAYGKTVWSWHPLLVSSRWRFSWAQPGSQDLNPPMTVTRRIRHRGELGISRKTIVRGMSGCSDCTCMLVCVFYAHIARETAGAASTRHSLRPLLDGRNDLHSPGETRRGNAEVCFGTRTPSLRGAKRRSNPFFLYAARWIASLRSQ
jgi:hypothetical protein